MPPAAHKTAPPAPNPRPAVRGFLLSPPLFAALLAVAAGCGTSDEPAAPVAPAAAPEPVARPAAPARPEPAPEVAAPAEPIPETYAAGLRARLLAGEADAVRLASPPGLRNAVGALRRALVRADPEQRADALAAVALLADLADRQTEFLKNSEAVRQGDSPGVRVPGWAAPLLRAIAAGPASADDPAALSDDELFDGTVEALLDDPAFRRGLETWTVAADVPAVPPAAEGGEEVTGIVELAGPDGGKAVIPVVASGGRWVPAVVEATLPTWAARADSAGGTGAGASLAAARPHLAAAVEAETQATFDGALRAATSAALAVADGPPAPVRKEEEVTVLLTRPLTARQAADLLPVLEAATDDPARAVSEAAPRPNEPGWRVTVGPVADPAAFVDRLPDLAGATVSGRTITAAYAPPPEPAAG